MNDPVDPIEDLQVRLAHQELAIDALTDTVAHQDRLLADLRAEVDRLHERLRALQPSPLGETDVAEPPPPHY